MEVLVFDMVVNAACQFQPTNKQLALLDLSLLNSTASHLDMCSLSFENIELTFYVLTMLLCREEHLTAIHASHQFISLVRGSMRLNQWWWWCNTGAVAPGTKL